jgi:hypothetical protein
MNPSLRLFLFSTATTISVLGGGYTAYAAWTPATEAAVMVLNTVFLPIGQAPVAVPDGNRVSVTWRASTEDGGLPALSYVVTRYGSGTATEACVATTTACREVRVPAGAWTYTVRPDLGSWRGRESAPGAPVTVSAAPTEILANEDRAAISSQESQVPGLPAPMPKGSPTARAVEAMGDRPRPIVEPEPDVLVPARDPRTGSIAVEGSATRRTIGATVSPAS